MKFYTVAVFTEYHKSGRPFYLMYLRDYSKDWEGCCIHQVEANSGIEAKMKASRQHKQYCIKGK